LASTASSPSATNQIVTLPFIPELFLPNYLDTLLRPKKQVQNVTPKNPMMKALKQIEHQSYTTNLAPAFDSTLSPVLDLFQGLNHFSSTSEIYRYLENAWAEDPELSLRIIWNARSIHEGKGDKAVFYARVTLLFLVMSLTLYSTRGDGCTNTIRELRFRICRC
jgi:hypothetical protein